MRCDSSRPGAARWSSASGSLSRMAPGSGRPAASRSPAVRTWSSSSEMLGYSEEEMLGMNLGDVTHPDDQAESWARLNELDPEEVPAVNWKKRYIHADGHIVWVQLNVGAVWDAEGKISYFLSQMQDVTAGWKAQAALVASEQKWRQAFDLAATGVALIGVEDGRFLTVNQAGCDMF